MGGVEGGEGSAASVPEVLRKVVDLGDLVGAVGDAGLGDDGTGFVDHGGEESDLLVRVGPRAAQDLAVQGDHQVAVVLGCRSFVQPGSDDEVQHVRVDSLEDLADRGLARRAVASLEVVVTRAELGEKFPREVGDLTADLAVGRGAGERRDDRYGEHEIEVVYLSAGGAEIFHEAQHLEKSTGVVLAGLVMAVRQNGAGLA